MHEENERVVRSYVDYFNRGEFADLCAPDGASVNTEFFDPATMQSTAGPQMNTGRWLHTMTSS